MKLDNKKDSILIALHGAFVSVILLTIFMMWFGSIAPNKFTTTLFGLGFVVSSTWNTLTGNKE